MYGKVFIWVGTTVLSGLVAALSGDNNVGGAELLNIIIAAGGILGVYVIPNLTGGSARYAKAIFAGILAALTLAVTLVADGVTVSEWLQVGIAFLAALTTPIPPAPQHTAIA